MAQTNPERCTRTSNELSCNRYVSLTASGLNKNGAQNVVASEQIKFASEARLRSVFPFDNTEPPCMPPKR